MQATTEHYHSESKYTGHPDGDEDRPYRHLKEAMAGRRRTRPPYGPTAMWSSTPIPATTTSGSSANIT